MPWVINAYLALILDDVYLSCGVVEDSLLGVLVDVKLRIFLGEPDEDIVAAVNIRVLWVPPSFGVLSMSDELIYLYL